MLVDGEAHRSEPVVAGVGEDRLEGSGTETLPPVLLPEVELAEEQTVSAGADSGVPYDMPVVLDEGVAVSLLRYLLGHGRKGLEPVHHVVDLVIGEDDGEVLVPYG